MPTTSKNCANQALLSICIPTRGERLLDIKKQVREFLKAKISAGNCLEMCLSINGDIGEEDFQYLLTQGVNAFRAKNSELVSLNIVSVMASSCSEYALILGDDDFISADSILSLMNWLQNDQKKFDVAVVSLVDSSHSYSVTSVANQRFLSPSQSMMRFASLPGLIISPAAAESGPFLDWLHHHSDDIYPQVAMCAFHSRGGRVIQVSSEVAFVEVGPGNGLISAYANRFPDYGCHERLAQARSFLRGNFTRPFELLRFQVNLALWISSTLREADTPEEQEFARKIAKGISKTCSSFRTFSAIFRFKTKQLGS